MAKTTSKTSTKVRTLPKPKYKTLRLQKRIKHPHQLPKARSLLWSSCGVIKKNWKLFGGISIVYVLISLLLVGMNSGTNIEEVRANLDDAFSGAGGQIQLGVAIFSAMVQSSGSAKASSGTTFRMVVVIVVSLAIIWALRQVLAGKKASVRDAFYKGMYPLVPFTLILLVIGLQLLPLIMGSVVFSLVVSTGVAATGLEQFLWGTLLFLLALLSIYMISSSLFALYIVTLPDVRPFAALRSARELVRFRRWTVMRKIIFLPVVLLLVGALITIPLILYVTMLASAVFWLLTLISLLVIHTYIYKLYRELL